MSIPGRISTRLEFRSTKRNPIFFGRLIRIPTGGAVYDNEIAPDRPFASRHLTQVFKPCSGFTINNNMGIYAMQYSTYLMKRHLYTIKDRKTGPIVNLSGLLLDIGFYRSPIHSTASPSPRRDDASRSRLHGREWARTQLRSRKPKLLMTKGSFRPYSSESGARRIGPMAISRTYSETPT